MKEYTLPQKTLLLWEIRSFFGFSLIFALFLFLCRFTEVFRFGLIAVPLLFVFAAAFYLPKLFESCKLSITGDAVIIKRGVFIENCHILPFSRMIYCQTVVTPLAHILNLEALTLKAARSRIFIPELGQESVKTILTELSEGGEV